LLIGLLKVFFLGNKCLNVGELLGLNGKNKDSYEGNEEHGHQEESSQVGELALGS